MFTGHAPSRVSIPPLANSPGGVEDGGRDRVLAHLLRHSLGPLARRVLAGQRAADRAAPSMHAARIAGSQSARWWAFHGAPPAEVTCRRTQMLRPHRL
jgi:hypothetical protein